MKSESSTSATEKMLRRRFCQVAGAGVLGFPSIVRAGLSAKIPKVAVVGADGMDPGLLHEYAAKGFMPNCKKLIGAGGFKKLRTTMPPQSQLRGRPLFREWILAATESTISSRAIRPRFRPNSRPRAQPRRSTRWRWASGRFHFRLRRLELIRRGPALWDVLQESGVPSWALRAPVNYPPSKTDAKTLCGLTSPDIHGSYGIFSFYTTDPQKSTSDVSGGRIERVRLQRGLAYCLASRTG